MPDYTIKNIKDVKDMAAENDWPIEARFARSDLESAHLGLSHFRVGPDFRTPFGHSHREQEEIYLVLGGSGRMKLEDETVELHEWDAVRVAPHVVRAFESGPEGIELLAIGSTRPEGGDAEQVPDFWPQ